LIGYDRLETPTQFQLLQEIYQDLRLYFNFFQPVLKLISKRRVDNKLIKRYDIACTPYLRLLHTTYISLAEKARLTHLYTQLNPAHLRTSIDQKVDHLWKISR